LRVFVAGLGKRGVKVDDEQVWRFVHAEGWGLKKKGLLPAEHLHPKIARRREQWLACCRDGASVIAPGRMLY